MSRDIFNRDKGFYGRLALVEKAQPMRTVAKDEGRACSGTYTPRPVKIVKKREEAPDVYTFRLDLKMDHAPGQFLQCSVLGAGESPISFASWNPGYVELNIKNVGRVSNELCRLKVGESMHVRGPYGSGYPMADLRGNDLIIVGAGTGVAPLRGVLDYVEKHRADYGRVYCYFGFRTPEDILFKDDFARWRQTFDICLSISKAPEGYSGPVGHCTDALQQAQHDNKGKVAIICGPPTMIQQAANILVVKGFHEDQIFVSHERHMKCATGVCGHCMIRGQYTCRDGPVFRYDRIGNPNE